MESPLETPAVPAGVPSEFAPAAPPARRSSLLREVVETALLTAVIFLIVNAATGRFKIDGSSMEPNLHNDEYVLVDKVTYLLGSPRRGDVVVFYRDRSSKDYIKRVVGLPGETVEMANGVVTIDGLPLSEPYTAPSPKSFPARQLGADEYFMMGDNRSNSQDSRDFGPIERRNIVGRAWIVYWPPSQWAVVSHHSFASAGAP